VVAAAERRLSQATYSLRMADPVDWALAAATGARLAPSGPHDDREDVEAAVRRCGN